MVKAARSTAAFTLALCVVLGATGWLYLLRPHVSMTGPRVPDALPLDELSRHSGVSMLLFVATWAVAAALLGALARWAGMERLTAGLLLGFLLAGWLYAANGVSILIVRQIPAHEAFHAAAVERAVVIPAALAGIAGALLGRHSTSRVRSRTVVAFLVSGVGVLALTDVLFPEHRQSLVTSLDPAHVHGLSKALVAPLAGALFLSARALTRGNRRAWQIAVAVLALLLMLNVERRFDEGAISAGIAVVALVARRADFRLRGDPSSHRRVLVHAVVLAAGIAAYGIVTLWINRLMADVPYSLTFALEATGRALAGLSFHGAQHLSGPVADWFPVSTFLLGVGSLGYVLVQWLAPWRHRLGHEPHEHELVRSLVARFGADTLAPFALRADKSYFFSADRSAFIAYRVVNGVAVVAGDPIGPSGEREALVRRFLDFAHERGWRVAVLGVSKECLDVYRGLGLRSLYHGDEAVVDTAAFSLEGRAIRKVRQSVHRLQKLAFTARVVRPSEIDAELRGELETIAQHWRGGAPERGFVMALDALFGLGDEDALFVVGLDAAGQAQGFLHFAIAHPGCALSLSSMPRTSDAPNGFNEWLICESIAWARENGFGKVSLNFAPFAALLAPGAELRTIQRLEAATLRRLKGHFQLDNLLLFNRKFFPSWQPRFLVYERRRDLVRVGVAALAAEAYLPFQ